MTKATSQSRYAVVSKSTLKTLKNANTRDEARTWKRESGKGNIAILDRSIGDFIR